MIRKKAEIIFKSKNPCITAIADEEIISLLYASQVLCS